MDSFLKPDFDYSFGLRVLDFSLNPSALFDKIKSKKFICSKCHNLITVKTNKTELTFKCNCGTLIVYPERPDRDNGHLVRFVSKKEKVFNNGKNK